MTGTGGATMLGFTGSAARRVVLAVAYGLVFAAALTWVEKRSVTAAEVSVPRAGTPGKAEPLAITLSTTFDVGEWEVLLDGVPVEPGRVTTRQWTASPEIAGPAGRELLVHVTRANMLYEEDEALRVQLEWRGVQQERTVWGAFEITTLLDLGGMLAP